MTVEGITIANRSINYAPQFKGKNSADDKINLNSAKDEFISKSQKGKKLMIGGGIGLGASLLARVLKLPIPFKGLCSAVCAVLATIGAIKYFSNRE